MTGEQEAIGRLVRRLEQLAIPYMIAGSVASSHHGRPRATNDADVVIDPNAIRELTRRFVDDCIAAVGGWVDVRNKHDNWLTRMQTIKYWYGYFFLKNLEWGFRRVMCLSGCLTAYRRDVLVELEPILEDRSILGVSIKYGEDRFLTRQIITSLLVSTVTIDTLYRTR